MDILLASSNIDGYVRAIEGDVCKIPEALSKQLTETKNEATLNVSRLGKVRDEISVFEEEQRNCIKEQKKVLKKIGVKPDKIKKLFIGKVAEKLDKYGEQISSRLTRGIPEDKEKAMLASNSLKPFKKKVEAIDTLAKSLQEKEIFDNLVEDINRYRGASKQWLPISNAVKSLPDDAWNIDAYSIPDTEEFDFKVFEDPSDIQKVIKEIQKLHKRMRGIKKVLHKYDIDSLKSLKRNVGELSRALQQFRNPKELPSDAVPVYVCPPLKKRLPTVSIPIDRYEPELAKVSSVTMVHMPKELSAETRRKIQQHIKSLQRITKKLTTYLEAIQQVQNEIEKIRKIRKSLLKTKENELEGKISSLEGEIFRIQKEWTGNAAVLYQHFSLGKMRIKFDEETYEKDLEQISEKINECTNILRKEIRDILKEFPRLRSRLLKKLESKNFDAVAENLGKRVEKLEKERKKLTAIQKWIQKESENIKRADHNIRCSRLLLKKVIPFAEVFYSLADKLINLEKVIEDLGNQMELNVETAYRSIFTEPTFNFRHIGKGIFIPQLGDEQITFPSGSQSSAVSFGVLYTLADQFGLPLIMDEAADRFDPTRLENFLELTKSVTRTDGKQVCLAIYETRNLTPEQLRMFNTYECVRISNTEKKVRSYGEST